MGKLDFNVGRLRRHSIPIIVWLAALLVVGAIFYKKSQRLELSGIVLDFKTEVAPLDLGVIKNMHVSIYQPVKEGEVLCVLDDAILRSELELVNAELSLLKAKMALRKQSEERRFFSDVEETRLTILQIRAELEPDKINLLDKGVELGRLKKLAAKNAATDDDLKKSEFEYKALEKKISINETRLKQNQEDLEVKIKRASDFSKGQSVDGGTDYIRNALNVESLKLKDLEVRLQKLVLRAPISGVVTSIWARSGDVVKPGERVIGIVKPNATEVLAFISPQHKTLIKEGDVLTLQRTAFASGDVELRVKYLGPAVDELPAELWSHPNYPQYGVPVTLVLPERNQLVPGEVVKVVR